MQCHGEEETEETPSGKAWNHGWAIWQPPLITSEMYNHKRPAFQKSFSKKIANWDRQVGPVMTVLQEHPITGDHSQAHPQQL